MHIKKHLLILSHGFPKSSINTTLKVLGEEWPHHRPQASNQEIRKDLGHLSHPPSLHLQNPGSSSSLQYSSLSWLLSCYLSCKTQLHACPHITLPCAAVHPLRLPSHPLEHRSSAKVCLPSTSLGIPPGQTRGSSTQ